MTSSTISNLVTGSKPSTSVTFTAPILSSSATLTAQSQPQIRPNPLRSATNPSSTPNYPPIFLGNSVNNVGGGGLSTTPSFYPSVSHTRPLCSRLIPDRAVTVANPNHAGGGYIRNPASTGHSGTTTSAPSPQQVGMPAGPHLSMRAPTQQPVSVLRQTSAFHRSVPPPVLGSGPQLKNAPLPGATMVSSEKITNEREKNMEAAVMMIHGRKVRLSEENSGSLYAVGRSWVRNGYYHDNQLKAGDSLKILPKPLPAKSSLHLQVTSEDDIKIDKDLGCAEQLAEEDLLKKDLIKRAKAIRARLRKERMLRIERYKQRLSILLPTQSELIARNEATP